MSRHVSITEISVADLVALGPRIRIIDVREDDEWADGHVPYAEHVALGTVPDNVDKFDGAPTYVICRSGSRSMQACEFVAAQGKQAVNVIGGMVAWEAARLQISTGPGSGGG